MRVGRAANIIEFLVIHTTNRSDPTMQINPIIRFKPNKPYILIYLNIVFRLIIMNEAEPQAVMKRAIIEGCKREICSLCGKETSNGPFCSYCQGMRDELRCWPK
jgi:hypothetical protein